MKLFLDDTRDPEDVYDDPEAWAVVRTVGEFKDWIDEHGTPRVISFDHDLGEDEPNGMQAAKWLVRQDLDLEDFAVHSANVVGRGNIQSYLEQWFEIRKEGGKQ